MNYTSQLDHDLIKEHDFEKEKIREQLNEAEKVQQSIYKNSEIVQKTPIVIVASILSKYDISDYGFYFETTPDLGKETYHPEPPAHTSYVVAVLWPETSNKED